MNKIEGTINANGISIRVSSTNEADYISLTDIAKYRSDDPAAVIQNWLRNRNTIEFLGLWEQLNNPDFKLLEFEGFRKESGLNGFVLSPQKWINSTNAIGIISKSGRYGGTLAHSDIAFEFASWISPQFKLYIIKDYQRLKSDESHVKAIDWSVKREIAKTNYRIHTDAIKEKLIPHEGNLTKAEIYTYVQLLNQVSKFATDEIKNCNNDIREYERECSNFGVEEIHIKALKARIANTEYKLDVLRQIKNLINQSRTEATEKIKINKPRNNE